MIKPPFTYDNSGLKLTETCEGLSLTSYFDPTGKVWTIGYGHTGKEVVEGLTWSQEQCESALANDIFWASHVVNNLVTATITQFQFDALVDFTFNEGDSNFAHSMLLTLVNKGDLAQAELEFRRWVYSGGKMLGGLVRRRELEGEYFLNNPQNVV
jgi:lysozyme